MTATRRIDLKAVLERTLSRLSGDLVTRPTGKAVRGGVVEQLADLEREAVVVIDFTTVRILDISCADEIVGKLLIGHGTARYFVLHGVSVAHCDSIEQVLERHQLAVVARTRDGRVQVLGPLADTALGPLADTARTAFRVIFDLGSADREQLASELSWPADTAQRALDELTSRRLVQMSADRYVAVTV